MREGSRRTGKISHARSATEAKGACHRINEHTGVTYSTPPLKTFGPVVLEPDFPPWRKAMTAVRGLHAAFEHSSHKYRVETLNVGPLFADFKFVHKVSNVEVMVEIKSQHCWFELKEEDAYMRHAQHAVGLGRNIFSWRVQWDFLYTLPKQGRWALFLPRDLIPDDWWNRAPSPGTELEWPAQDVHVLKHYTVDLSSAFSTVTDFERILDRAQRQGSMRAVLPAPAAPVQLRLRNSAFAHTEIDDVPNEKTEVAEDEPARAQDGEATYRMRQWSSRLYQRGFGSCDHEELRGDTYEVWAAEALTELCRNRLVTPL